MKRFLTVIFLISFVISCNSQKSYNQLQWKEFVSQDAGIKAYFPCEVKKMFKSFQEKPQPINYFGFYCEIQEMTFEVWSRNYTNKFNDETSKLTFEERENVWKMVMGDIDSFEVLPKENIGLVSKLYKIKSKNSQQINELVVVDSVRYYTISVGINLQNEKSPKESNIDFEVISKRFIDSFQILNNK